MSDDQIKRIKNQREARRINRLFGSRNEAGSPVSRFFDDLEIPAYYPDLDSVPRNTTGVYFIWSTDCELKFIGAAKRCVHRTINRMRNRFPSPTISIVSFPAYRYHAARFTAALLRHIFIEENTDAFDSGYDWIEIKERFWSKVDRQDDVNVCWEWLAGTQNGYGLFYFLGGRDSAHRVAYLLSKGEIPAGTQIRLSCGNKLCCNPTHLVLKGEASEND